MSQEQLHDEYAGKKKGGGLGKLGRFIKPQLPAIGLAVLISLVVNATVLAKPWIIKLLIDQHLAKGETGLAVPLLFGLAYLGTVIVGSLIAWVQACFVTTIGQRIMSAIRLELFAHVQNLSLRWFDRNSTGRILTRITNDVEALSDLFSTVIVNLIRDGIMVVGLVATMILMDARLALISVSCLPLIVLATVIYRIAARKNFVKLKGMIGRINGFLAENISGMKLVQIFHREKEKHAELQALDREYFRYSLREVILNGFSRPIVDVINNLTIAMLIWFCVMGLGSPVAAGPGQAVAGGLAVGTLYAFISYIRQFFEPISAIAEQYTTIQSAVVSADRVFEVLDTRGFLEDRSGGRDVPALSGRIEFHDVWFAYNEENWVLKGISFTILPGQTVAFVGSTGSGKSTIISLMARFYEIQKGAILIDGVNIKDWNLPQLRRRIAVVMQDVFLFSGTIAGNIRLNEAGICDQVVREAACSASATGFIERLDGGFEAEVHERGCTFSSGERQLVSFARAIAFDPSVIVLDEATASIDSATEQAIQAAMATISTGRTTIIIAHRLATIRGADHIHVLTSGRIVESGSHQELVALQGDYARLVASQSADYQI